MLQALLWGFRNSPSGCCFPSYGTIAERALKALEWAGVLTRQLGIRVRKRCLDLFGRECWQWRVHRRSNAYASRGLQQQTARPSAHQSENLARTQSQDARGPLPRPARNPDNLLAERMERAEVVVVLRLLWAEWLIYANRLTQAQFPNLFDGSFDRAAPRHAVPGAASVYAGEGGGAARLMGSEDAQAGSRSPPRQG